jgi:hypothetical protein
MVRPQNAPGSSYRASPGGAGGGGGSVVAGCDTPEPARFERFNVTYPSGTVTEAYYCGGATLREVQVTHPLAVVEVA